MLIADVVKVLGNTTLKEFPWGCAVRDTVNLFTVDPFRLSDASTGTDVLAALESLPVENRDLVLKASIDPNRRCTTTPIGGGMVVEHVDSGTLTGDELVADNAALRNAMLTPQFMGVSLLVLSGVSLAGYMISTLSVHEDIDWGAVASAFFKVFGLGLGG
ncbi:hypothetical protein D3C76_37180 [compost metagenome]